METDLDKSLLDVEREHGVSSEQADWETRQPQTGIEIHDDDRYASVPFEVIKDKWGFLPSASHMTGSEEMHNCLRDLVCIIANRRDLPPAELWDAVVVDDSDECVLIFWKEEGDQS